MLKHKFSFQSSVLLVAFYKHLIDAFSLYQQLCGIQFVDDTKKKNNVLLTAQREHYKILSALTWMTVAVGVVSLILALFSKTYVKKVFIVLNALLTIPNLLMPNLGDGAYLKNTIFMAVYMLGLFLSDEKRPNKKAA